MDKRKKTQRARRAKGLARLQQRVLRAGVIIGFLVLAVFPFGVLFSGGQAPAKFLLIPAALNLAGWSIALALLLARRDLRVTVSRLAGQFGIDVRFKSFETIAFALLREMERKNSAMLANFLERRITSREELSRTLERIVAKAYRLVNAESAELALFDKESGLYHSSFVLGRPFRRSAQAMLSGVLDADAVETEVNPDVLVQPVAFGGSVLGSLRVGLPKGVLPSVGDREIMHLLALQGGLAIINAQYTDELMRMKRASEESVRAKTGFLANLSHELRGPLGLMINAVELVLDGLCGPVSDDQLDTLRMVRGNGEHLLELINDVLDYAKVESGKIVPDKVDIVVNDILKDLVGVVRAQAEAKGHTLVLLPAHEALTIRCDRRHLRQMLINILTNAIKYTQDKGRIELWAERIPGGKIKINVSDNGVGIEEADREKVFTPFERIENSYSISQVGTGLGMPLTKRLAEVNGGSVDFSSTVGSGSHFWLIFNAEHYAPEALAAPIEEARDAQGRGELVLLVEPNSDERSILSRYLSHLGFRVTAVGTKLEAMHVLREEQCNLVIMDNSVIDNTPDSLPKEIRESARSARLPIVLLSSRAFVFDIEKYLKAGVDRCLSKPVTLKDLGQICRKLLDGDLPLKQPVNAHNDKSAGDKANPAGAPRPALARDIVH